MTRSQRAAIIAAIIAFLSTAPQLHAQFTLSDIYDFDCGSTGCRPLDYGQLTQGANGNLYGTTQLYGSLNCGSIFMLSPDGTTYQEWPFDFATQGCSPRAGLTLAQDGNFYGTTYDGGSYTYGTVFRFNPTTTAITVLHHFTGGADGGNPQVPPVEPLSNDGYLFGLAQGTDGAGLVPYAVNVAKGTVLSGSQQLSGCSYCSASPLVAAPDGYLYATTGIGGSAGKGSIIRMTLLGVISTRYSFTGGSDGGGPNGPLAVGSDGLLYGTTGYGGLNSDGGIFKFTSLSKMLAPVYSFSPLSGSGTNSDGAYPIAGLVAASDGNLYGTAQSGGANAVGTVFRIATGGGSFTTLASFTQPGDSESSSNFVEHTNGSFYAVAPTQGGYGYGYVYELASITPSVTLCCNWWLVLDQPVFVFGENLEGVFSVTFSGAPAQFQSGSNTYLTAEVPSAAIDGPVVVTLATGLQVQSQQVVHILPKITNLDPSSGPVGTQVGIVGGGFASATTVTFGGVAATNFTIVSPSLIQAIVPTGAQTGKVKVTTPNGTASSTQVFTVN